jgi:hypothetical protein
MVDGRKNNGGARPGAGRPPKEDEQKLIEQLSPHDKLFIEGIGKAMRGGESWAFKLFADYRYGKPTQRIEQTDPNQQPRKIIITTIPGPMMPIREEDIIEDIQP